MIPNYRIQSIAIRAKQIAEKRGQISYETTIDDIIADLFEELQELKDAVICERDTSQMQSKSYNEAWVKEYEEKVKNTIGDEIADVIMVSMNAALKKGLNVEKLLLNKLKYNLLRND